jgi:hypothetical protein
MIIFVQDQGMEKNNCRHMFNIPWIIFLSITQRLDKKTISGCKRASVHPEMVDFGFRQGPSEFSTAGIACYVED